MNKFIDIAKTLLGKGNGESGQVLIMAAGTFTFVLALAAIAIDGGFFAHTKRDLQNDVDAMVLAAVRDMPDTSAASAVALSWAARNGVSNSEIASITFNHDCAGAASPETITVELSRSQPTFLARVMGINEATLTVCASARTGYAEAGPRLLPFGLLWDDPEIPNDPPVCYYDANDDFWGTECAVKIPSPSLTWTPGNSGPLRLDDSANTEPINYDPTCDPPGSNSGADEYDDNIINGADCSYAPNDEIQTFPGSFVGPTCDAIDELLLGNDDTIEQVFKDADGDGVYEIVDTTSPRYGLIPVVLVPEGSAGASTTVAIKTFAPVYIIGCDGGLGAQPASVLMIPMKSKIFLQGIDFVDPGNANYDNEWPLHTIKLIN